MSSATEFVKLHELIGGLRRRAAALAASYGNTPATRRIISDADRLGADIDRLDVDTEELEFVQGVTHCQDAGEKIAIPNTAYDTGLWREVDDEGIGGLRGS